MRALLLFLLFIAATATAFGAFAFWCFHELNEPYGHGQENFTFTVSRGASTEQVLARLKEDGIIKDTLPLKIYLKVSGKARIRAGDYKFPSPLSPIGVMERLAKGGGAHAKLTIIEGWDRFDIAEAMLKFPVLKLHNRQEALAYLDDTQLIKDIDTEATSLEGYLFPDTYYVHAESTPKDLVSQMILRFRQVWAEHLAKDASQVGLSTHKIVTIASIIETEAKLSGERPIVASVLFNRVRKGMRLSMDSTVVYASKLTGHWKNDGKVYMSDLRIDSPYNTRKYLGLPPGPIASPSLSSLDAALHPTPTDYLYYVREPKRNDGAHNFYSNVADFDIGVQALRKWEKQQRNLGLR